MAEEVTRYVLVDQHFGMLRRCIGSFDSEEGAQKWIDEQADDPTSWSVLPIEAVQDDDRHALAILKRIMQSHEDHTAYVDVEEKAFTYDGYINITPAQHQLLSRLDAAARARGEALLAAKKAAIDDGAERSPAGS